MLYPQLVKKLLKLTEFGPITISLNRSGPDGNFRVWFTDVEVK